MNYENADNERLRNLEVLSELIEARSIAGREFKRAIGTLDDDIKYVADALWKRPGKMAFTQLDCGHIDVG
ncbi:MAG: hypothetical protein ABJD13_02250 [Paracoccaceae bacterium]